MTDMIASDNVMDTTQRATLQALVGLIIPASATYQVPGADDALIFAEIVRVAEEHADTLRNGLDTLAELAQSRHNAQFAELEDALQVELAQSVTAAMKSFNRLITSVTAQCYYRDDRVMASLGMPARAPFPEGFTVEQGDWSLLDPVRARQKIYREVD